MNVSAVVLHFKPEYEAILRQEISETGIAEFYTAEGGKMIVLVEGTDSAVEMVKFRSLQQHPLVISACMVVSYCADEIEELQFSLSNASETPEWLNNEDLKAEDIRYEG